MKPQRLRRTVRGARSIINGLAKTGGDLMNRDDRKSLWGQKPVCCFTNGFGTAGRRVLIGCERPREG